MKSIIISLAIVLVILTGCSKQEITEKVITEKLASCLASFNLTDELKNKIDDINETENYLNNLKVIYGDNQINSDSLLYEIIEDENNGYIIMTKGIYDQTTVMLWSYSLTEENRVYNLKLDRTILQCVE